jgi:hypothetical protein
MTAALYIIVCSARNRFARRLRRLREPRYLVGAVAGISYLLFTLFIRPRAYAVRSDEGVDAASRAASASAFAMTGAAGGSVLLAAAAFACWVFPFSSGLLEFSKAETAFLFPSPLTRGQLVIYRLMRSQFAVFTGALIMALAYPTGSLFARMRGLIGMWLVLMTSHVFFTGVTLARERLRRGRRAPFMWPALVLPGLTVVTLLGALFARAERAPLDTVWEALEAVVAVTHQNVVSLLLLPFSLLVRPLFAPTFTAFAGALAGGLAVYAVTLLWLLWADAESADTADAVAERQVNKASRLTSRYVARPMTWMPRVGSSPEMFFVWKGVLQTFRTVDRRVMLRAVLIVGWMVAASLFVTRARGLVALVGVFSTWGALFAIFMAPQIVRMDMRQDLAHLELLKTWPVRGAVVVRGEIIWSAVVVTAIAWVFGVLAMVLSLVSASQIPTANRIAVWTSFLVLIPAVVLAQYTLHNAVALLFPAWVPLGASRPRGVDAVGQRLILLAANWLGLVLALLPGVLLTAVLSLLFRPSLGPWVLPIGAVLTTAIVVGEAVAVSEGLGGVYERLDVTSIEHPD